MARKEQAPEGASPATKLGESTPAGGKGHATPTRREKEAARKRPLVANDRAERRRQQAKANAEARERTRVGIASGDERFMQTRDKGPQRRYVRDYVDARTGISEVLFIVIGLYFISSFMTAVPYVVEIATLAAYAFILATIIDVVVLGFVVRRKLIDKFGSAERGVRLYAALRAAYLRPMRLPKPKVKRGDFPS